MELLEPAVELDRQLELIEEAHQDLLARDVRLGEAVACELALRTQALELARHEAHVNALVPLVSPPELAATEPLENLIASLQAAQTKHESSRALAAALASLPPPPELDDVKLLERLSDQIAATAAGVALNEVESRTLNQLSAPPELVSELSLQTLTAVLGRSADDAKRWSLAVEAATSLSAPSTAAETRPIAELIARLQGTSAQFASCQQELRADETELVTAADELRNQAAGRSCSVCGSALDPDRVVARAAAGLGVHDHD